MPLRIPETVNISILCTGRRKTDFLIGQPSGPRGLKAFPMSSWKRLRFSDIEIRASNDKQEKDSGEVGSRSAMEGFPVICARSCSAFDSRSAVQYSVWEDHGNDLGSDCCFKKPDRALFTSVAVAGKGASRLCPSDPALDISKLNFSKNEDDGRPLTGNGRLPLNFLVRSGVPPCSGCISSHQ